MSSMSGRGGRRVGQTLRGGASLAASLALFSTCNRSHAPDPSVGPSGPPGVPVPGNSRPSPSPVPPDPDASPNTAAPRGYLLRALAAEAGVPADALPMDVDRDNGRVLVSSFSAGLFELDWPPGTATPVISRSWKQASIGNVGEARYGAGGAIYVNVHQQGLAKIAGDQLTLIGPADGLVNADLLDILVRANGDVWVVGVPNPFGGGGGVQVLVRDRPAALLPTANISVGTLRSSLDMPDRRSVFATSEAGVLELDGNGLVAKLSPPGRVARLARQPGGAAIGAVGAVVERWDGAAFTILSDPFRLPPTGGSSWDPLDLAISPAGDWMILCADGVLSVTDAQGRPIGQFDASSGVPLSARRILVLADGHRALLGGERGAALLSW